MVQDEKINCARGAAEHQRRGEKAGVFKGDSAILSQWRALLRRRGYGENAEQIKFKAERLSLGGRLSPSPP